MLIVNATRSVCTVYVASGTVWHRLLDCKAMLGKSVDCNEQLHYLDVHSVISRNIDGAPVEEARALLSYFL